MALRSSDEFGFVYLLSHPRILGLVKIGYTNDTPIKRLRSINIATGVPPPGFKLEYAICIRDAHSVEKNIHERLAAYRADEKKEFFELSPDEARITFENVRKKQDGKWFEESS